MTDEFGFSKDEKFVDVHGREIATTTVEKDEVLCLLSDLKQTGVAIYRKNQYAKLSNIKKDFGQDFVEFMLEQAKEYMLSNRISFSQDQIMNSIQNAKRVLTSDKTLCASQEKKILNDRQIEKGSDDEIHICISNVTTPSKSPHLPKRKSPGLQKIPMKSPRQHPIGRETDFPADYESQTTQPNLNKQTFPKKGLDKTKCEKNEESKRYSTGRVSKEAPKLRLPKNDANRRFVYNLIQKEQAVIVTQIDKPNCVWVRDVANGPVLEQIHKRVNEEAKYQPVASKPYVMDKMYMAKEENAWFRCKVVKFQPLTVFFLDYGNVAEMNEIKEVSEQLANIPCLAVRITFTDTKFALHLEEEIRVKPFHQNADGTFFVNILTDKTNPVTCLVEVPSAKYSRRVNEDEVSVTQNHEDEENWDDAEEESNAVETSEVAFFKKPQSFCSVQNEQRVVIIAEKDGEFFLRTKEGFEKLKEVDSVIQEYYKTTKTVKNVQVEQLVLFENTGKIYRAVVNKVNKNNAEIEFLDFPESHTVDLGALMPINEQLSKEAVTYFSGGKLLGFEKDSFDEGSKKMIREFIQKRTKFTVVLGFENKLDLYDGSSLLSEKLKKSEKLPKDKYFLKNMKTLTPEIGTNTYICGCYKDSSYFSLVPKDLLSEHIDTLVRGDITDRVPYAPVIGEICLCHYEDGWYRCVVTRNFDQEYEVLFLDFGNIELKRKEDLKKPDDDITKIPILGLPCVLTNLPQVPQVEDLLRKMVLEGELYNVDVKQISEGRWQVEIPSVYKKIEEIAL